METNKPYFCFDNGKIVLLHKNSQYELFNETQKLNFVDNRFAVPDKLNIIGVSPIVLSKFRHQKMALINMETGNHINVSLTSYDKIGDNDFVATSFLKDLLNLETSDNIYLCQFKDLKFNSIKPQRIDHIRESDLVISENDYNNLCCDIQQSPCKTFEVYNTLTHESIIVKKSHIFVDNSLKTGSIRLSRKLRICLGLELPQYLSTKQWNTLKEKLDNTSEDYKIICELYGSNDHILNKSASFNEKAKAKTIISQYFSPEISIIPVPESIHLKGKTLLHHLCDFYVGKSTISLVGRRPYEIDEGLDIVRMTKSNMNLLGINEMDKVILQYKNNKISCRVLELDDKEAFYETNLPISLDLVVGIPAHIRKKLQLTDLSTSIKIDRDTFFIFKKSLNEQVVPILLTLFSTNLFTSKSALLSIMISIIAVPIVMYLNLSSKRNMRA